MTNRHGEGYVDIEIVAIGKYNMPSDVVIDPQTVVGRFSTCDITKGDYLFPSKLSDTADNAADVFMHLDGRQVAMSITIPSFAGGLSGKLTNGDIVSLIVYTDEDGEHTTFISEALKYVRAITSTTAGGLDKDELVQNEDGTYELPTTLTLLVDSYQAKLLTEYENNSMIHTVLVSRGGAEKAKAYLSEQKMILEELAAEETEKFEDDETESEGDDHG